MTLTKQTVLRLYLATPDIRLINGVFNEVSAIAKFERHSYELRVKVTHPLMAPYAGSVPHEVVFMRWEGCNGKIQEVPAELFDLVSTLRARGTMTDANAQKLRDSFVGSMNNAFEELGIAREAPRG